MTSPYLDRRLYYGFHFVFFFFFSSRRRHTRWTGDWSSDVCSSDLPFDDLDALEAALGPEDVAVFIVEPVQGHGPYFPSEGYLERAQELCRRYGTLFCVDEVQTGFGRTRSEERRVGKECRSRGGPCQ